MVSSMCPWTMGTEFSTYRKKKKPSPLGINLFDQFDYYSLEYFPLTYLPPVTITFVLKFILGALQSQFKWRVQVTS